MKLIFLFTLTLISVLLKSQDSISTFDKAKFLDDKAIFYDNLSFPRDMAIAGKSGMVVLSFRLNERGILDSLDIVSFSNETILNDVAQVLLSTRNKWTPTYENSKAIPYWYKFIVYYDFIGEVTSTTDAKYPAQTYFEKAEKYYEKEKFDKSLESINKALQLRPYSVDYFKLRYNINTALHLEDEARLDKDAYETLDKNVMEVIDIAAIGIVRTTTTTRSY
ncbi:MAG: energy transducer TonB [Bacteroidales bacterium]|nr:energy transducer TonB [Bacteroidales bacterium]